MSSSVSINRFLQEVLGDQVERFLSVLKRIKGGENLVMIHYGRGSNGISIVIRIMKRVIDNFDYQTLIEPTPLDIRRYTRILETIQGRDL